MFHFDDNLCKYKSLNDNESIGDDDLHVIRNHPRVHGGPAGADCGPELVSEVIQHLEIVPGLHS